MRYALARRAGVGKGTIYLHWASKLELFATVLIRDAAEIVVEQPSAFRAHPEEIRFAPHDARAVPARHAAAAGPAVLHRRHRGPRRAGSDTKIGLQIAADKAAITPRYLAVLHENRLLTDDPAAEPGVMYRLSAAVTAFFVLERLAPPVVDVDLKAKADALATTVRRGFELAADLTPQALEAAAPVVIELYERLLVDLARSLPEEDTDTASGTCSATPTSRPLPVDHDAITRADGPRHYQRGILGTWNLPVRPSRRRQVGSVFQRTWLRQHHCMMY